MSIAMQFKEIHFFSSNIELYLCLNIFISFIKHTFALKVSYFSI